MKLLKVTPVLLLGAFSYTQAALVAITNFNMESAPTKQADGGLTGALATGWTYGNISGSPGTFTFNTTTTTRYYNDPAFADTSPSGGASGTMAGPNFTGLSGTGSGYIQQTLTATVAANTQYTLTAALGHRTVDSGAAATASPGARRICSIPPASAPPMAPSRSASAFRTTMPPWCSVWMPPARCCWPN